MFASWRLLEQGVAVVAGGVCDLLQVVCCCGYLGISAWAVGVATPAASPGAPRCVAVLHFAVPCIRLDSV